jgi:predicted phosphodiesterase
VDVTTVADDLVVLHDGATVHRFDGLEPDTAMVLAGQAVRTLPRPPGALLSRVVTVNDVHFGEVECGRIDDHPEGPILRAPEGAPPYPETMNRAAAAEIEPLGPDAVVVKGDLTDDGTPEQFAAFEACWAARFGDRLYAVRGNHDSHRFQEEYVGDRVIDLPGLRIALLDTVIPGGTTGTLTPEQLAWLDDAAASSDRPVLVLGHHQNWVPGGERSGRYFGMHPDPSDGLIEVVARRPSIIGYAAGHTHRNRVRRVAATGDVPYVEVAAVKDFPGSYAEYRVYEGGVLQVHHRISAPEALAWSEACRVLYRDFGVDYAAYALGRLEDRCFVFPSRG